MPQLNICPRAHMLQGMKRNPFMSFKIGLEELFDNSSDAGATSISVELKDGDLIIWDNGRGLQNPEALFAIGAHESSSANDDTIGRYGVGFKDMALLIANVVSVDSCNGIRRYKISVDWRLVDDRWKTDYSNLPARPGAATFTRLVFSALEPRRVRFPETLLRNLAYDFSPGLRDGLKITINGVDLAPCDPPVLMEELRLDDTFGGRHFRLLAGIKADNAQPDRLGYDVAYKNRLVLRRDTDQAFGDYSSQRFYAYLELLRDGQLDWTLGRNKQSFEEREDLYIHLFPEIEELLKKADQLGRDIEFKHMEDRASIRLSTAVTKTIKEKRKSSERQSPAEDPDDHATDPKRKRRRASKTDPKDDGSVTADPNGGRSQWRPHSSETRFERSGQNRMGAGGNILHHRASEPAVSIRFQRRAYIGDDRSIALYELLGSQRPVE